MCIWETAPPSLDRLALSGSGYETAAARDPLLCSCGGVRVCSLNPSPEQEGRAVLLINELVDGHILWPASARCELQEAGHTAKKSSEQCNDCATGGHEMGVLLHMRSHTTIARGAIGRQYEVWYPARAQQTVYCASTQGLAMRRLSFASVALMFRQPSHVTAYPSPFSSALYGYRSG